MKQNILKKWVENLRSGKFEQGKAALRSNDNKYCCLGVLCETIKEEMGISWQSNANGFGYYFDDRYDILPYSVVNYCGIPGSTGDLKIEYITDEINDSGGHEAYTSLTELNDHGLSFLDIANIIEHEYKE